MAKSSLNRREFLKISALSSSGLFVSGALAGCTSLDRLFTGDKRNLDGEVVILGAGAAGLAAAYTLKKNKIPYRLFEASSRLGGRVQSVSVFPGKGPIAELGAEFFEESHRTVFALAKELSLNTVQLKTTKGFEAHYFRFDEKNYRVQDILPKLKTLTAPLRRVRADLFRNSEAILTYQNAQVYDRATYYDSLSLKDLLNSWANEVDPVILELIESQAVSRFGVDADEQSALHFLSTLDSEGSSLLSGRNTYRLEVGMTNFMQLMGTRVAGVIPDNSVKMNHALVEISEKEGVFKLDFQTPQGRQEYQTRHIICTLPFTKLREVHNIQSLSFSDTKKEALANLSYATHSKGVLGFDSAFWLKKQGAVPANLGNFTGDFLTQKFWDSSREQSGTRGLLSYSRAGKSGLQAGAAAEGEALFDLDLFYKNLPEKAQVHQMVNWKTRPWAGGSMAYYKKGQYMKFRGAAGEAEYGGRFLFAGEHTSLKFPGTLNGALETGILAATSVLV
ncbi:flavin monoamine oxidase family protein [Bdellovibrio sp. HCB290]|uniref:flavin monoamine oxidase family protein n=1 Tax=Bdellovibrio sp. HCB290 TaxID=3394356 RepID=UPI0039B4B543